MARTATIHHRTTTLPNGTRIVRAANDNVPEWRLQASQVRSLRAMPEHGRRFLIAGDMASGRRGPRAQVEAKATGLTPGEADLRIYLEQGRLLMVENKTLKGRLSPEQRRRHEDLTRLGHKVVVIRAATEADAAAQAVALVRATLDGQA